MPWRFPLIVIGLLAICIATACAADPPATTNPLEQRLSRIIIPRVELREVTFQEALDFILHKVQELDPKGRGINTTMRLEASAPAAPTGVQSPSIPGLKPADPAEPVAPINPADARLTLQLKDVPALEALKYITSLASLKFQIDGDALRIIPVNDTTPSPAAPRK